METIMWGFDIQEVIGNMWYVVLAFIVFDVATGILRGAIERRINSSINFEGLVRKCGILLGLAFITFLDAYFQTNGSLTKIGVGMIVVYEGMSIIENFSRIGVDLKFLTKYFDKEKVKPDGKVDK